MRNTIIHGMEYTQNVWNATTKRIFFRLFGVLLYDDKNYTMRVLRTVGCFIEWK